jgi:hypothetical protein
MSKTNQNPDKKSTMNEPSGFTTASQRRLRYGTNVLVMCLAALVIVVFLNVISFKKHVRKDLAVAGVYQPSERTKRIVDAVNGQITLTSVYTGRDEENQRDKYFPAVQDFLQELQIYAPGKVKTDYVSSDTAKAALLARIQGKYSTQAKEYRALIDDFGKFTAEANNQQGPTATQPALRQSLLELTTALGGEQSYLAGFPQVADLQARLTKNLQALADTQDEVKRLTKGTGMPRYMEAKEKISQVLDQTKETVATGQKDLQSIGEVSKAGNDEFFKTAAEHMKQLMQMVQAVQATVGDAQDTALPQDPKAALQTYAKETGKAVIWLNEEAGRQEDLAKKYPAIAEMPNWLARLKNGIIEQVVPLPGLLRQIADEQTSLRQQVRQILTMSDIPADRIAAVIRELRTYSARQVQIAQAVSGQISKLGGSLTKVDPAGAAVLEQAGNSQWQAGLIGKVEDLKARIAKLPEIKLSEVSDKLDTPNTVIAETAEKVEVLSFDDVWPQSEPMRAMTPGEPPRRVFNGDAAVTGAILSLSQPPVATVIFTHYVGEVPPQMRQFMPPQAGSIPFEQLNTLRQALAKANFIVKEWNLAKDQNPPEPDKGTKAVYVFLPPPQDQPMPGPQDNKAKFGEPQLAKVKETLDKGGRGIFLCRWEPPTRAAIWMPPAEPKYGYEELLKDKYGVDVLYKYRTVFGIPEQRTPGYYGVNVQRWGYMPLNDFTDMPIGRPLQGRRVLMLDVCPVAKTPEARDGMTVDTILTVPNRDEYWAAEDVVKLVQQVVGDREKGGLVTKQPGDKMAPFGVAVAVSNKNEPAAVILGTGGSVLDGYLSERVPRIGGKNDRLSFDPPPTANADLVVNSVLWLTGRADLIGAGPVILPPVRRIPDGQMALIRGMVWVLLPSLVLIAGGAVFAVRRR